MTTAAAPAKKTLLSISEDIRALERLLEEKLEASGGEMSTDLEKVFDQWFSELAGDAKKKIDGYCSLVRERELTAAVRKSERDRLDMLVRSDETLVKRLKYRLLLFMRQTDQKSISTDHFKVNRQTNGGFQPVRLLVPIEELPEQYMRVEIKPEMDNIRADLSADKPEAKKVAEYEPRGEQLRIY